MKRIFFLLVSCVFTIIVPNNISTVTDNQELLITTIEREIRDITYGSQTLPQDFSHMLHLIKYGKTTDQPLSYINCVVKIFGNMIKGSLYVNPYAFIDFLEGVKPILQEYFIPKNSAKALGGMDMVLKLDSFERLQEGFSNFLCDSFMTGYPQFKKNPESFLKNIANTLFCVAQEEINMQILRKNLLKFMEVCLNKLVWTPYDGSKSWESAKLIGNKLAGLLDTNIINDVDDIDDCLWSVVHRFCFFVELTNDQLTSSFYQHVLQDLAQNEILLIDLDEQAPFIESKRNRVKRIISLADAQLKAAEFSNQRII